VEDSETVIDLKEKIEKDQGYPTANMKILYAGEVCPIAGNVNVSETDMNHTGKILQDGDTIGALGIKEEDFLVLMVSKVCDLL
jgi:hypothetical protein